MSAETFVESVALETPESRARATWNWSRLVPEGENLLVSLALAAMMVLPLAEIVLRRSLGVGIKGSTSIVQHLTLIVGMLGGALAARENRLLSLSNLGGLLKGRLKTVGCVLTGAVAVAISASLCLASGQFVASEKQAGQILAYGVPVWTVETVLPIGFALVTFYLVWHAADRWPGRLWAGGLGGALILAAARSPVSAHELMLPALVALLVATVLGVPVFVTLGGVALIFFWSLGEPIASIPVDHYSLVTSPSLATIPLFTLAGYFLAESKAPQRLIAVFSALLGRFRAGPVIISVLVCAFFTTFTGASGVTILALGGLLMPVLLAGKYSEKVSLGLLTSAGSLGLLFPPCLPLILYAIIAKIPIEKMFLGGLIPGALMMIATAWWSFAQTSKTERVRRSLNWPEARAAIWEAKWELALPVVAFVSLFSGYATPVEAAAVTALYAFIVETFVHRDLSLWKDVPRVMTECGLLVGGVLLILGVALGFTNYLVDAEVTRRAVEWTASVIQSPWVFLLALNLFLLIVGCLMDIYSAIVIQVPLLVPLGQAYHIDPIHLGIIFLANLEIGYLTPPVGLNLFLASFRFKKPLPEVTRAALPIAGVLLVAVLLITYIPVLTTALPRWLGH
jgi:tripartite ATP-independent transporter DctM subunit